MTLGSSFEISSLSSPTSWKENYSLERANFQSIDFRLSRMHHNLFLKSTLNNFFCFVFKLQIKSATIVRKWLECFGRPSPSSHTLARLGQRLRLGHFVRHAFAHPLDGFAAQPELVVGLERSRLGSVGRGAPRSTRRERLSELCIASVFPVW